ncbi:hypothetical protein [Pseudocitrobacter faecalis]|uniref:hypothetical protein n=1 Tax=Pseudocitrobacter faecalis TaxID=1398493 RepID=UPI003B9F54E9
MKKLSAVFFDKVNVITATTAQQTDYLFNADLQYPFIYIRAFGRKTYVLIRSLRVSYSGDAIYAFCDTLMTRMNEVEFRINLNLLKLLYEKMKASDETENRMFIRTTELLAHGRLSPAEASKLFRENNIAILFVCCPLIRTSDFP